jgi:class 3 adenylate cyclase
MSPSEFAEPILSPDIWSEACCSGGYASSSPFAHPDPIVDVDWWSDGASPIDRRPSGQHFLTLKQQNLDSFSRFVPRKFLDAIAPNGIDTIEVGQFVQRQMTILFCDIRDYTAMTETMSPMETFEFLNSYLACMGAAIEAHGGFIDKYIGDAIMVLFDEPHSDSALDAALAMQAALDQFNEGRLARGLPTIVVGMGLHRGTVILGTIGFASRIEFTVIGDAVNVASRIERFTRQCNCPMLLTEAIVTSLQRPENFEIRLVNPAARVRGKAEPIGLYQLYSPQSQGPVMPIAPIPPELLVESGCCPDPKPGAQSESTRESGCCPEPEPNPEPQIQSGCCSPDRSNPSATRSQEIMI